MYLYHYTTYSNWLTIQSLGLHPYFIDRAETKPFFPGGFNGIWLWERDPTGLAHAGAILYQMATKNQTKIVKLRCRVEPQSLLLCHGNRMRLLHEGTIGSLRYHEDAPAVVCVDIIPPKHIKLIGKYDVVKLLA